MSTQEQGDVACRSCDSDSSGTAGRSREGNAEMRPVEELQLPHVSFSYLSTFDGSLVQVDGELEKVKPGVGVVSVRVDRLWYAVPAGTLVTIETRELR